LIVDAQANGYSVTLIFFYLNSQDLAVKRVETRVKEGGHDIPEKVIRRRYENGLNNFFNIFRLLVNDWMFIENSGEPYKLIAQKTKSDEKIYIDQTWKELKKNTMENKNQIDEQTKKILRGLEKSYQKLVEFKKYKKSPLIVSKDGVIVEIQPEKILPTTTKYSARR